MCTLFGSRLRMNTSKSERILQALTRFRIEIPSWGFANTGTRFGKFIQAAAATTTEEKFSDAGQVHLLTGVCPTIALHVLWDFPAGINSTDDIQKLSERFGVQAGSINPNLFQDQEYKYGSFGNPDPAVRKRALEHVKDSVEHAAGLRCRVISVWLPHIYDIPVTAIIGHRKQGFEFSLHASEDR